MNKIIKGNKIELRPATPGDKRKVFEWLTKSNLTKEMMGPPDFPDSKIPDWDEFDKDYYDSYFDGSAPLLGRCFIILEKGDEVGQINYNEMDTRSKITYLDIWLKDRKYIGKGIGSEAIKLLCGYLYKRFNCEQIAVSPSLRNQKAIRFYKKAGFVMTDRELPEAEKDYYDNVVLIKKMSIHDN